MKPTHLAAALVVSLLICTLTGCDAATRPPQDKSASGELDFGTVSGSTYSNRFFGFTLTLPEGWSIQSQEAQRDMLKRGGEMIAGSDKNLKALAKASELQTVPLLTAFAHPMGAPVAHNAGINAVAERVEHMPGIRKGSDYLFHMRKALEAGQMKVVFPKDVWTERVGGRDFDVMPLELPVGALTVRQRYYVVVLKGYALGFITSASSSNDEAQLKKIIDSVRFN